MGISVLGGYLLNLFYDGEDLGFVIDGLHEHSGFDYFFLLILIVLFGYSIVKRGARSFIKEIFVPHVHH